MSSVQLITTHDGSHSLLNTELNETYHSLHGAMQESIHVFILHGLNQVIKRASSMKILEVGFGTGLNAWLTLLQVQNQHAVEYTTLETFPLTH
ncbi:MAG: methyltransferase, partial [Flammeovirgaceae bacterium]|nr:methyltransferase [Flammeovirgaceae bacterium]